MIAFACSVSEAQPYIRYAAPGIRVAREPDSQVLVFAAMDTISRSYNLLLHAAGELDELEALVLVHPHAEIADPELCAKVRNALSAEDVAVVGAVGASAVRSLAWWDAAMSCGSVTYSYTDYGGGSFAGFPWTAASRPPERVEVVDGFLLALSPWAVRNLRFDEQLALGHGYDVDLCLQARAAGRRVVTADLAVIEHRSLDIISDLELWVESHIALARKWGDQLTGETSPASTASGTSARPAASAATGSTTVLSPRQRARRAEAERECARAIAYFKRLGYDTRVEALERSLNELTSTTPWRLTEPLRRINKWRRDRGETAGEGRLAT